MPAFEIFTLPLFLSFFSLIILRFRFAFAIFAFDMLIIFLSHILPARPLSRTATFDVAFNRVFQSIRAPAHFGILLFRRFSACRRRYFRFLLPLVPPAF